MEEGRTAYLTARRDLRTAIKAAKAKCWFELCDQVDHDPWGKPYGIVMKKFRGRRPGQTPERTSPPSPTSCSRRLL